MNAEKQLFIHDFQHHARMVLAKNERERLYKIFKDYQHHKQVNKLVAGITKLLASSQKRDLILKIRLLVPHFQLEEFDRCVIRSGLATASYLETSGIGSASITVDKDEFIHHQPHRHNTRNTVTKPLADERVVTIVKRNADDSLGFSVRGGSDHNLGIFVSEVDAHSSAHKSGLMVGDRILEVNTVSLAGMSCHTAAKVLNGARKLKLVIERTGKIPGVRHSRVSTSWFDTDERKLIRGDLENKSMSAILSDPWPNSAERKINLSTRGREALGFNIRGGSEFNLGIYISRVDVGGVAERTGLRVGDQIMSVNGTSFLNISHEKATSLLRAHRHLIVTVKATGRYPVYKELCTSFSWMNAKNPHRGRFNTPRMHQYDVNSNHAFESKIEACTQTDDEDEIDDPPVMMSSPPDGPRKKRALRPNSSLMMSSRPNTPQNQFILRPSSSETDISHSLPTMLDSTDASDDHLEQIWSSVDDLLYDFKIHGHPSQRRSRSLKQRLIGSKEKQLDTEVTKRSKVDLHKHRESSGSVLRRGVFEKSFGSQMMYQMSVEAAILVDLEDRCRRFLERDEASAIIRHIKDYHTVGNISHLTNVLHLILDTPTKRHLLDIIRDVIHPSHLATYDRAAKKLASISGDVTQTEILSDTDELPGDNTAADESEVLAKFEQIYSEIDSGHQGRNEFVNLEAVHPRRASSQSGDGTAVGGHARPELEDLYAAPWKARRASSCESNITEHSSSMSSIDSNPVAFDDLEAPAQWAQSTGETNDDMRVYELVASTVPSLKSIMRKFSTPNSDDLIENIQIQTENHDEFDNSGDAMTYFGRSEVSKLPSSHITQQTDDDAFFDRISEYLDETPAFDEAENVAASRGSSIRGQYTVNETTPSHSPSSQIDHYDFLSHVDDYQPTRSPAIGQRNEDVQTREEDFQQTIAMLSKSRYSDDFYEENASASHNPSSLASTLSCTPSRHSSNFLLQSKYTDDKTVITESMRNSTETSLKLDDNSVTNDHSPIFIKNKNPGSRGERKERASVLDMFAPKQDYLMFEVPKVKPTLGLSISGGVDSSSQPSVKVEQVVPGGSAHCDGRLEPGMEIVSVDAVSLIDATHSHAVNVIRQAFTDNHKSVMTFIVKNHLAA